MRNLSLIGFIAALLLMQVLVGGAGLAYGFPGYLLLAVSAVPLWFVRDAENSARLRFWRAVPALLFGLTVIVRSQLSPVEYLARWDFFLALGILATYFAVACHLTDSRQRAAIVAALLALALVHVVTGVVQFKEGNEYMLVPGIIRSKWEWRASGFYIYPNMLAGLLEMLTPIALSLCCWMRCKPWVRVLFGYSVMMCMVGIAMTGSRGGYLSIVVGLLVFAIISLWIVGQIRPDRIWPVALAAAACVVILIGGTLLFISKSFSMSDRLAMMYDPKNMRLWMWEAALKQFALSPISGTGSGTYLFYGREFRSPMVQADPMHVHCDYLELLSEYGVIGASLGVLFLVVHFFSGYKGIRNIVLRKLKPEWRTSSDELALVVGATSGIAAILTHSVTDFNFHLPANALVGAVLFAIVATPTSVSSRTGAPSQNGTRWFRWIAPSTAVVLLALAVPRFSGEYFGEMARRALRDREYDKARQLAERAIESEKKNPNLYFYLGEARHFLTLEIKDPVAVAALHEQAAEAYEEGLRLFPKDTRLLLKLGQTLDLAGRYEDADAVYRRAIENDPNFGNVYAYYGLHWMVLRHYKLAQRYFRKAGSLGEWEVSGPGLAQIEEIRKSPLGSVLMESKPGDENAPGLDPLQNE